MPRMIGDKYNAGATKALRHTMFKGTIPCCICGRPAAGKAPDGRFYCQYHARRKYGFLPGVQ